MRIRKTSILMFSTLLGIMMLISIAIPTFYVIYEKSTKKIKEKSLLSKILDIIGVVVLIVAIFGGAKYFIEKAPEFAEKFEGSIFEKAKIPYFLFLIFMIFVFASTYLYAKSENALNDKFFELWSDSLLQFAIVSLTLVQLFVSEILYEKQLREYIIEVDIGYEEKNGFRYLSISNGSKFPIKIIKAWKFEDTFKNLKDIENSEGLLIKPNDTVTLKEVSPVMEEEGKILGIVVMAYSPKSKETYLFYFECYKENLFIEREKRTISREEDLNHFLKEISRKLNLSEEDISGIKKKISPYIFRVLQI